MLLADVDEQSPNLAISVRHFMPQRPIRQGFAQGFGVLLLLLLLLVSYHHYG